MDKRNLHHVWTKYRAIKPWYFLILLVISASVSIYALRLNNHKMGQLRAAVYSADKNNTDVNLALKNLQAFVTSHMNTSLTSPNAPYPPIQLQFTYERLQQASFAKLGDSSFYTEAQSACQAKFPIESSLVVWQSYVSCVQQYVSSHHINIQINQFTPPASLYEFDFQSPTWSPDLAGWSLVASVIFLILFVISLVIRLWLKHYLA